MAQVEPNGDRSTAADSPRTAATVVLMRDAAEGFEVLLTERPRHLRFMGGASVFPGGSVAPEDGDPDWEGCSRLSRVQATELIGTDDHAAALGPFVCALREAFEEVGYLADPGILSGVERSQADDAGAFLAACTARRLILPTDRLVPAGRWVTPFGAPVRFDTHFFVTRAPGDWAPRPDPAEVAGCRWVRPAEALAELATGSLLMAPPTIEMLQLLMTFESVAAALEGIGRKKLTGAGNVLSVRISPLVGVVLAPNPSLMTGPGTNTYVVGSGPCAVIDPAVPDDEYLAAILAMAGEVNLILITHRHPDHVGGAGALADLTGAPVRAFGPSPAGGVRMTAPISDGEVIDLAGTQLEALHTPGHASDHLSFLMRGAASLFAGDNILGEGTAVIAPPDGDMALFLSSLQRVEGLHIDRIFPGHFRPLDGGLEVIRELIEHRLAREASILQAVQQGAATPEAIVGAVYSETPPALHPIAVFSVLAHLEKLQAEGWVRRNGEHWSSPPAR